MLDVRDVWLLEVFVSVIDNGSMAGAARERHLTTPTVSEAISKLEKLVGSAVLVRSPSGCHPTAEGRRIETLARDLLASSGEQLQRINSPTPAPYRIGSTLGAHSSIVAEVSQASDSPPMTPVSLALNDPGQDLLDGVVDLALLMGPTQHDHHFHRVPILTETRYAVVGRETVSPGAVDIDLARLDERQWPSIPPDADSVYLHPWVCADVRPGLPPHQGPVMDDFLVIRDWIMANPNDAVVATTRSWAEAFGGIAGITIVPIAAPAWTVDLVGMTQHRDVVADVARTMRKTFPPSAPHEPDNILAGEPEGSHQGIRSP